MSELSPSLSEHSVRRYARQILLAPIGGAGQLRIAAATVLLHGDAPLCATYLAAAGLGTLLVTGPRPELAAHDPAFRLALAEPDAEATLVVDLGDGRAYAVARGPRLWGGVDGPRVRLGIEPHAGAPAEGAARAVLETLAAGEALWRVLGQEGHVYEFRGAG